VNNAGVKILEESLMVSVIVKVMAIILPAALVVPAVGVEIVLPVAIDISTFF